MSNSTTEIQIASPEAMMMGAQESDLMGALMRGEDISRAMGADGIAMALASEATIGHFAVPTVNFTNYDKGVLIGIVRDVGFGRFTDEESGRESVSMFMDLITPAGARRYHVHTRFAGAIIRKVAGGVAVKAYYENTLSDAELTELTDRVLDYPAGPGQEVMSPTIRGAMFWAYKSGTVPSTRHRGGRAVTGGYGIHRSIIFDGEPCYEVFRQYFRSAHDAVGAAYQAFVHENGVPVVGVSDE